MAMIIVRLYKDVDGTRKYLSKQYKRTNKKKPKAMLTKNRDMAMVFKTTEELVQFQYMFTDPKTKEIPGIGILNLEREELTTTFEDEFGVDALHDTKQEMISIKINQDKIETRLHEAKKSLQELKKINLEELSPQAKADTEQAIINTELEVEIYEKQLEDFMEGKDVNESTNN